MRESSLDPATGNQSQFTTTHWSVVLSAGGDSTLPANEALEKLCRTYWYPLYAFARRRGYGVADAQDLTQGFFERLLEKDYMRAVDPKKGKFRSFLLAALEHYVANEWRRRNTQKRGGQVAFVSLDDGSAEQQYLQVPATNLSPEKLFEQQWATAMLEQVLGRLRDEHARAGKSAMFEELKTFLTGEKQVISYAERATIMGTTEAALKMAVSRMRQRYGELLREEIANTVARPEDVEEEMRALFAALSG